MSDHSQTCPRFQHAIDILAKRWTAMIIFVLMSGPLRFNEIAEQVEDVSDRMLSERLKELEHEGIVSRSVIGCTPVRVEYALTEKGRALAPALTEIQSWSHRWIELETPQPEAEAAALGDQA